MTFRSLSNFISIQLYTVSVCMNGSVVRNLAASSQAIVHWL